MSVARALGMIAVPAIAVLAAVGATRLERGRRYRVVVRFRPPLEGDRDAWRREVRRAHPGASDVTITPRAGETWIGWAFRAPRVRSVEPGRTTYSIGGAEGVLERVEAIGEVRT